MARLLSETLVQGFHDSFDRVKERPGFFDVFYERFLASSDEVAEKFAGLNLARIKRLLRDSFYLILMASDGNPAATKRLEQLGDLHEQIGIGRHLHDLWLETLMSVVEEFDPRYDAEVDRSWRAVLGVGIDLVKNKATLP